MKNRNYKHYLITIGSMLLGYISSVMLTIALADISLHAFILLSGRTTLDVILSKQFIMGYIMGSLYVGFFAFPGWLVLAIVAKWQGMNNVIWFALGGALVGLSAVMLEMQVMQFSFFYDLPELVYILPLFGGLFGGLAYWAVAVRQAGIVKGKA